MSETHWKKLTNPNYLGSWDFAPGEERSLTIARIDQEEVFNPCDNAKKSCVVAYFKENAKPMVLNKTNMKMIQTQSGTPIIERWSGVVITVGVERVKAFGKMEDALRIKKQTVRSGPAQNLKQAATRPPESMSESESLFCGDCSNIIEGYKGYSAKQIASTNLARYGIQICASCSGKRKTEEEVLNEAHA